MTILINVILSMVFMFLLIPLVFGLGYALIESWKLIIEWVIG